MTGAPPRPAPGRVVVAGALHLDVIVSAPRLPRRDETLMGEAVRYALGGKAGNQAVAAARMGAPVTLAARVGSDAFGARLTADLTAAGLDLGQVQTDPGASGMSVAILEPGGEYGAVVVSGANRALDPAAIALPADTAVLCLQNEVPEPVNLALAAMASAAGISVVLNAAPARALPERLRSALAVLVVNRLEARDLTGLSDPRAAAARLAAGIGGGAAIVTCGAEGLALAEPGRAARHHPAPRITPVSAHGAGDVFTGALAAGLAAGRPLAEAAQTAQAAAALAVSLTPEARATLSPAAVAAFQAAMP